MGSLRVWIWFAAFLGQAATVDRIAVVVGNTALTESEVAQEARLEALLNQEPLDLAPASLRAAAERLVDQQLVRIEMKTGGYAAPTEAEVDSMRRHFIEEKFHGGDAAYRAAIAKYGVTEEQVKQYLAWQLAAIRFTDVRFAALGSADESANRAAAGDGSSKGDVDQQFEAWLKDARSQTKIQYKSPMLRQGASR